MHVLHPLDLLVHLLVRRDDRTSSHHVVTLVVLRQALNDHVCSVVQWSAHDRSCKSGVDYMLGAACMGNVGDCLDVSQGKDWVCRSLTEDQLCVWLHMFLDDLRVSKVNKIELHSQGCKELTAGAVGASVGTVRYHTVVSCFHCCRDCTGRSCHARPKGRRAIPILAFSKFLLQGGHCWIVGSRVAVTLLQVFLHGLLDEGGRQEERCEDCSCSFIRGHGGMHQGGVQLIFALNPCARLGGVTPGESNGPGDRWDLLLDTQHRH
mmetsp:Transcript_26919/g.48650  ORF Transcript_26919/g.48650 Transcript_26919/m.48650 type:complete len:264 (+) Transcript_26919:644-1435(+)